MITSKKQQITEHLRTRIEGGEFDPPADAGPDGSDGGKLPTEEELGAEYDASRNTIRNAIEVLVNEGLLERRQGSGTYVRRGRVLTYDASPSGYQPDAAHFVRHYAERLREESGIEQVRQELDVRLLPAHKRVARRLGLEVGAAVIRRRHIHILDGSPWWFKDSFYPADIAEGTELMNPVNIDRGTIKLLAELGHEQVGYTDTIRARMPNPAEQRRLELGPGVPVIVHARTANSARRPIRLTVTIFPADRNELLYDLTGEVSDFTEHAT
ncbi:GntR family transcriptional regulator [Allonocardiopsis opalescens]|uniref:GntR family transcriptional regulator n=1 Tax=Allonocardiopsis opalescens TaxID=1144618 RepID=A0A2T0QD48_9ACTN|nr:GntR family transcriptional regulator [Allonocardiopsis opalescens]PRY01876.1 GntR family transcriptional regulator [Allonocardiopsis opalescens]